jgi:hypothetical protein
VQATSGDRSEDILVWALGPKLIDRMRVRFSIENADSRARFQTPIKKITWRCFHARRGRSATLR